ncbi:hypothetical protein SY85_09490 [Flavisolibacter tropicus]|uniref:Uncharacterized protein n=1 Tax=Flavisolibacter tropicus TaxID=1492898 RepID=A0A172TUA9_9BACT|nr:hypothetical protein SY85_09490 [Flavisolibacter tropicus]
MLTLLYPQISVNNAVQQSLYCLLSYLTRNTFGKLVNNPTFAENSKGIFPFGIVIILGIIPFSVPIKLYNNVLDT